MKGMIDKEEEGHRKEGMPTRKKDTPHGRIDKEEKGHRMEGMPTRRNGTPHGRIAN
jgi:hypothetical protein